MKKISLVGLCMMSLVMLSACASKNVAVVTPTTPTPSVTSEVTEATSVETTPALAQKAITQKAVTKTITPTATTKPATTPVVAPVAAPKNATVSIQNFAFSTPTVRIKKGAKVTWTNLDPASHTVTSDSGAFASETLPQNKSFTFTFNTVGSFAYHCKIHPSMKGTVIVE